MHQFNRFLFCGMLAALFFAAIPFGYSDYEKELRDQIAKVEADYKRVPDMTYFRDMGIIARKADEAELAKLTSEIVRLKLLDVMDEHIKAQLKMINALYPKEPVKASRLLDELGKQERFYEPTSEFLNTAFGQSIATDLSQFRENAIGAFQRSCSDFAILTGVQALRKSGLFITKSAAEITQLRQVQETLGCCLGWKPELYYRREQPFETEYEQGVLVEEGRLQLRSNRTDYSRAEWAGDWVYHYTGREGKGDGISQGVLTYQSGADDATLAISSSRVSTVGRMNFPAAMSGEKRTISISGLAYNPQASLYGEGFSLKGCRDKK